MLSANNVLYGRGPQPLVPARGLLATGPRSRRWAAVSERSFICHSPSLALPPEPPPRPFHGKIVFHKTGSWCQKGWGLLLYGILFHPVQDHTLHLVDQYPLCPLIWKSSSGFVLSHWHFEYSMYVFIYLFISEWPSFWTCLLFLHD